VALFILEETELPLGVILLYRIQVNLLNNIVAHFDQFPLEMLLLLLLRPSNPLGQGAFMEGPGRSAKQLEFPYFKEAISAINNGEHLTRAGMDRMKVLAEKINTGRN
jgi:hypothetical protein